MRIASLGSGSSGNATLIDTGDGLLLVDCGLSAKETKNRLSDLDLSFSELLAILVTHEHVDHISGVAAVAKQSGAPVFATRGTSHKLGVACEIIRAEHEFLIPGSDVCIKPVAVPHDAREPVQFTFAKAAVKVGVLTDLGSVTPHVVQEFAGCHSLLIEANHCRDLLLNGPYPAALKRRILGPWGHLSNQQTSEFLEQVFAIASPVTNLIIGHISKENNSKERVQQSLGNAAAAVESLVFASQDEVLPWSNWVKAA